MKIYPIVEHEAADERMKRKAQSAKKMMDEHYPLAGLWSGDDLFLSGSRWAVSLARYPASRSSLMFFSMTEEAMHLPYALDPDMVGVLSRNGVDRSLSAGG